MLVNRFHGNFNKDVLFFKKVSANYQKKGYNNPLPTHNAVKVNKNTFNPLIQLAFVAKKWGILE